MSIINSMVGVSYCFIDLLYPTSTYDTRFDTRNLSESGSNWCKEQAILAQISVDINHDVPVAEVAFSCLEAGSYGGGNPRHEMH
ncbi:MAG: hypothetical protein QF828_13670 [Pseudomonadales bacterium]|nr:hypothetical protein [Pseudomonadales bacterium]